VSESSRSLPDQPSLRFLKLEARRRLAAGEFRALYEAQLAIAREYGFSSWTALKQVIVGDAINAQGGSVWLKEKGFDIVDLASAECIDMMRKFKLAHPELWDECIGDG